MRSELTLTSHTFEHAVFHVLQKRFVLRALALTNIYVIQDTSLYDFNSVRMVL